MGSWLTWFFAAVPASQITYWAPSSKTNWKSAGNMYAWLGIALRFVFSSQAVPRWPHQAQVCNHYFISLLDSISGKKHENHSSVFMVNNLVLFFPRFSPARLPTLTKLTCERPTRRKMQTACLVTLKDRRMLNEPILCVFHFFRLKIFSVFCQCSVVGQFKTFGCF